MRGLWVAGAVALAFFLAVRAADASVTVHIDKSTQRMSVAVDGATRYVWPVSTGRAGYGTPSGSFRPQRLARTWFSKKYYNSPMPYSIFFHGGFAIHGSYEIRRLGGPASHGCVRLHPSNAATLYGLVQQKGMGATRIVVSGANPAGLRHRRPRGAEFYRAPAPVYAPYGAPVYAPYGAPIYAPYGGWFD